MPDDVQFVSPTTGKVQVVPPEHWQEALSLGYQPVTHKVMYSPDGQRGMVPNEQLKTYMKQGYQTTPTTQFEKERAPGYRSPEDIAFLQTLPESLQKPTDIGGVMNAAMLGVGGGGIAKTIAQKGLKTAIGPLARGIAGATGGGAAGHYLGKLVGMPEAGAAIGTLAGGALGGLSGEKVPVPEPEPFPPEATSTGRPSMTSPVGQTQLSPPPQVPVKPAAPSFGSGMTSSATPIGNAELPPAPKSAITTTAPTTTSLPVRAGGLKAPPPVNGEVASPSQPTSLLSRGRTLITPGMEPDLNDPTHVKMINDYQTMSGPKLRELAGAGDRFAAFVLRHMPRP